MAHTYNPDTQWRSDCDAEQNRLTRVYTASHQYHQSVDDLEHAFLSAAQQGDVHAPAPYCSHSNWTFADVMNSALDHYTDHKGNTALTYADAYAVILEAAQSGQKTAQTLIEHLAKTFAFHEVQVPEHE